MLDEPRAGDELAGHCELAPVLHDGRADRERLRERLEEPLAGILRDAAHGGGRLVAVLVSRGEVAVLRTSEHVVCLGLGGGDALLVGPLVRSAKLVQLHVLAVAALAVEPDAVAVLDEPLVHGVLEDAAHLGGVGRDARAPALVLLIGLRARLALPLRLNHLARRVRLLDVHVLERRVHVHRAVVREHGVNLVHVRALVDVQVDGDGLDARLGAVRGGARVEACLPLVDGLEPRTERGRRVERGLDVPDLQNRLVHLVALHVAELVEGLPAARVALPAVGMNGTLVLGAEMRLVPLARRLDGYSDLTPAGQLGAVRVDVDVAATALLELVVILTVEAAVVVRERVAAALRVDTRLHLLAHVVASLIRVGC